jgi:hypothetical protein
MTATESICQPIMQRRRYWEGEWGRGGRKSKKNLRHEEYLTRCSNGIAYDKKTMDVRGGKVCRVSMENNVELGGLLRRGPFSPTRLHRVRPSSTSSGSIHGKEGDRACDETIEGGPHKINISVYVSRSERAGVDKTAGINFDR